MHTRISCSAVSFPRIVAGPTSVLTFGREAAVQWLRREPHPVSGSG